MGTSECEYLHKKYNKSKVQKKLGEADPILVAIIRGLALRIGDANDLTEKYWRELSIYKSLEGLDNGN